MQYRVGLGHDRHRLEAGRAFLLGGVEIPHTLGLAGHSDADVLLHALIDALLGACCLGDIGELFPDTDPRFKGIDSTKLLAEAYRQVTERGWRVENVDCTVFAQQPKLSPYKQQIAGHLRGLLDLADDCVNVKAKTGERVGPIGREEAVDCSVVVLLSRDVS